MAKKTQRPSVINMGYEKARTISFKYDENDEQYLRSIVRDHIPNPELVLSCADRENLIHHARTIRGVAKRLCDYQDKQQEPILRNIERFAKTSDTSEREFLDERVCIQLEGCRIPDNSLLVKKYEKARDVSNN